MKTRFYVWHTLIILLSLTATLHPLQAQTYAELPDGVEAVWDLRQAYHQATATQEKICINGLWLWQPAASDAQQIPSTEWGWIKVPAPWPGKSGSYMWRETQIAYPHPEWKEPDVSAANSAWYQREITIPAYWKHRRVSLSASYVNSYAIVYVDGIKMGTTRFPGGDVDITPACSPGKTHTLSINMIAMPLKAVVQSFSDTNAARQVKGDVALRGLCGDVFLTSTPTQSYIHDVKVETSVRNTEIRLDTALKIPAGTRSFRLHATIRDNNQIVEQFESEPIMADQIKDGHAAFSHTWIPEKLWDTHTPRHTYDVQVSLRDSRGNVLDEFYPVRFGFREFWIDGRDFILNGSRIFCFAVPFDNAQISAAAASYDGACETMRRLQSFGVNAVYTHNYGCEPGVHLGFEAILKAADDTGMLIFFSQPHFSQYDWEAPGAAETNGYHHHAEFYVRQAQNHPSVVMYSMSHNATGYSEDMNPFLMDGQHDQRDDWAKRNMKKAIQAEEIVRRLDPTRIVYHHAGGNFGPMHTSNFYLNFVPIQERSEWFGHWATQGIKPLFLCEYGVPWGLNWTMYRGWYQGKRDFGSARVPWQFCMAEWNAQFLGDRAYQINQRDRQNLRYESSQAKEGKTWYRWDYPNPIIGSYAPENDMQAEVWAMYINENWRAFRTWGLSGFNAWSYGKFWELHPNTDKSKKNLPVDWKNLQTPGFSPDYIDQQYERIDTAYNFDDWLPTDAGKALIQNNQPLLAYLAGKPDHFTSRDHNYTQGQTVEKQIVIINNSRKTVDADYHWSLQTPEPQTGKARIRIKTGTITKIPLPIQLPSSLSPGAYEVTLKVRFNTEQIQEDSFTIHVLPTHNDTPIASKIALFDPNGETAHLLHSLSINTTKINNNDPLSGYDMLLIGKGALTLDGVVPDIRNVREGLKVIVFEQTAEVLEKRLGFRVQKYGLRRVFTRIADHPILTGLQNEHLRDWNGSATILPPTLNYTTRPMHGPTVQWSGMETTRPWRCGNWGNVASVLIEKPTIGDFMPIVEGGFNLQYAPLLEYREGKGVILFCQLDVTGRTETEPTAQQIVSNLIRYMSTAKTPESRKAVYAGEASGLSFFKQANLPVTPYHGNALPPDHVFITGPEAQTQMASNKEAIHNWLASGGKMLAMGMDQPVADIAGIPDIRFEKAEYINSVIKPFTLASPFAGISPADLMIREPQPIEHIKSGAEIFAEGILAYTQNPALTLAQLPPWHFDYTNNFHRKITFRRTSFMLSRLLANMGVRAETPLIDRFANPIPASTDTDAKNAMAKERFLHGLYLDQPEEMDDPYRFFRW